MADTEYASERYKPKFPVCGATPVSLHFDGATLTMKGIKVIETSRVCSVVDKPFKYPAVSGKPVGGKFDDSRERQTKQDQGPIPDGRYWVTPSEIWTRHLLSWVRAPRSAWGDYRLSIHPYPMTKTHGRGGFFIHGGDEPGSGGCIDLTGKIGQFVSDLRAGVKETQCHIDLTVDYSTRKAQ